MIIPVGGVVSSATDYFNSHKPSGTGEETARLIDTLREQGDFLTNAERREIKNICLNFIRRVGSEDEMKTPAEIAILPEMVRLLLVEHF